jgi:hypothetical protein
MNDTEHDNAEAELRAAFDTPAMPATESLARSTAQAEPITAPASPDSPPASAGAARPAPKRRRKGLYGRRGSIDDHPDRPRIERDLALGVPLSRISKKYGVGLHAAWRYKKKLPPQLMAKLAGHALKPGEDLEAIRTTESEALLGNLAAQRARLLAAQDMALEAEQLSLVAQLGSGIHRNLELVGKYLGEFAQHHITTSVSILVSEEYLHLRAALLRALGQYPEARRAVAAELHRIEAAAATMQRPPMPVIEHKREPTHAAAD